MSSTTQLTGPMLKVLNATLDELKRVSDELWTEFEVGINPIYTNYGVPDVCSQARAFELTASYCEDIERKKKQLSLLREFGIAGAMNQLLAETA